MFSSFTTKSHDIYKDTKDVLKAVRNENEERLKNHLILQGSFFRNVIDHSPSTFNCIWSSAQSKLYVDLPGFLNPSTVTGDSFRPDLLLAIRKKCLYILELTVGFESNLQVNAKRKHQKYHDLIKEQESIFGKVKFVNLSLSTLGVFGQVSESPKFDGQQSKFIKKKIVRTYIQTSYYIFCKRNKVWDYPKLRLHQLW